MYLQDYIKKYLEETKGIFCPHICIYWKFENCSSCSILQFLKDETKILLRKFIKKIIDKTFATTFLSIVFYYNNNLC